MATVQKTISDSGSLTTKTLTTTISAPGIRQDATVNVSPNINPSKVSYTINEAAGTIKVTLTSAGYTNSQTSNQTVTGTNTGNYTFGEYPNMYLGCNYSGEGRSWSTSKPYNMGGDNVCAPSDTTTFSSTTYYFNYTVTVEYKTFPEFAVKASNQKKKSIDGWAKINNTKRQLVRFWVRANGQLKEI